MDNQAKVLSEQNNIEEISEIKIEKLDLVEDDIHNIEVIEIKMDLDSEYIYEEDPDYDSNEIIDIANIPVNEDIPEELILSNGCHEDESFKEEKLDDEEMAILEKDLKTTTQGYEHLTESSNTVGKPTSITVVKVDRVNKSTVCRICGKVYATRTGYLRHLLKQHSNHAKPKKEPVEDDEEDDSSNADPPVVVPPITRPPVRKSSPTDDEMRTTEMCHICGKIFRHKSTYRQHLRDQHNPNGLKPQKKRASRMCDLCGKVCSGGTFREHMRKHTNPESVTCEHCGLVFSFVSVLKSHIQVRHSNERPFQCAMCPSSFKRADYLRSHMRYKHEPKLLSAEHGSKNMYKCDDCGATFRSSVGLSKHQNLRESKDGEPPRCPTSFKCSVCDLSFKKRNYLVLHKRYVHEKNKPFRISEASVGPYKCDKCDRRFASVCGRNYHCKHTHGVAFNTKFSEVCDHCGLTFRNRVFFAKHSAKQRDKPTCYLCWNAFDTQDALREHVHEVHVDDLPFNCQTCNNRFVTLRQLNDHIRSRHEKIRPFQCHYCPHSAVRKDSLEVHIRSCHLGEKPFKCDLCDKAFSQSSDVRKHRIIHTRNKSTSAVTPKKEPVD